jgi:hypothetical protein
MHTQQPPFTTTAIVYVVAIAILVWRMARPQRTSVVRLWIMPLVLLAITALSLWASAYAAVVPGQTPPPVWQLGLVLAIGAAIGIPLGFLRGRHSVVTPAERPGVMYVHSSPLIVVVWLAAFVARAVLRAYLPHTQGGAAALGGDALLAFAMGALITSYYVIYGKYRLAVQRAESARFSNTSSSADTSDARSHERA